MQEEVTQKTIALSMKTGKLTAQALQAALKKYLQHRAKGPKLHHGKQSLKQLKAHGAALTNIEVTEANVGAFKPCAKKYGVDFTLRKDKTTQPPHYIVIFKAKDLTPVKLQIGNIRDIAYAIPIENFLKLLIPRYIPLRFPMRELYESQSNYDKLVSNTRSVMKNHKSPFVRPMLVIDGNARVTDEGILI